MYFIRKFGNRHKFVFSKFRGPLHCTLWTDLWITCLTVRYHYLFKVFYLFIFFYCASTAALLSLLLTPHIFIIALFAVTLWIDLLRISNKYVIFWMTKRFLNFDNKMLNINKRHFKQRNIKSTLGFMYTIIKTK